MNTPLIVQTLKNTGLSTYEAKCCLALFERGTLTVPEVSKLAGIPRPNAYEALENLMSKGMCVARPGNTKKYGPSDPALLREKALLEVSKGTEIELANLKKKEKEILEKAKAAKENIDNLTSELKPRYEKSALEVSPLDYIEIIKDPYQIHKRFMQLVGEAKEEILGFTKPPYSPTKERMKEQVEQQVRLIKKGLKMRTIWEIPKDEEMMEWLNAYIAEAAKCGDQVRVVEELPIKMAIFDSRIVMYALVDPVSKQISLTSQIVEHPALAKTLKVTFETLWAQAEAYHILKD